VFELIAFTRPFRSGVQETPHRSPLLDVSGYSHRVHGGLMMVNTTRGEFWYYSTAMSGRWRGVEVPNHSGAGSGFVCGSQNVCGRRLSTQSAGSTCQAKVRLRVPRLRCLSLYLCPCRERSEVGGGAKTATDSSAAGRVKNEEPTFKGAGEVDNFRLADQLETIGPSPATRVGRQAGEVRLAIDPF